MSVRVARDADATRTQSTNRLANVLAAGLKFTTDAPKRDGEGNYVLSAQDLLQLRRVKSNEDLDIKLLQMLRAAQQEGDVSSEEDELPLSQRKSIVRPRREEAKNPADDVSSEDDELALSQRGPIRPRGKKIARPGEKSKKDNLPPIFDINEIARMIILKSIYMDPNPCKRVEDLCGISKSNYAACEDIFDDLNKYFGLYGKEGKTLSDLASLKDDDGEPLYTEEFLNVATPKRWFSYVCTVNKNYFKLGGSHEFLSKQKKLWLLGIFKRSYPAVAEELEKIASGIKELYYKEVFADEDSYNFEYFQHNRSEWEEITDKILNANEYELKKLPDPSMVDLKMLLQTRRFAAFLRNPNGDKSADRIKETSVEFFESVKDRIKETSVEFFESVKENYDEVIQMSSFDMFPPWIVFVRAVGEAALILDTLQEYEFYNGGQTYADAGIARGFFGYFRKKDTDPSPSEEGLDEEGSDEEGSDGEGSDEEGSDGEGSDEE